jgi:hypothetical protein
VNPIPLSEGVLSQLDRVPFKKRRGGRAAQKPVQTIFFESVFHMVGNFRAYHNDSRKVIEITG